VGRSFRRAVAAAFAGAAVATVLAACSPERVPLHAIALSGTGEPVFVVHACKGSTVMGVSVYEDRATTATDTVKEWSVTAVAPPGSEFELPLFAVPQGWQLKDDALTGLADGVRYGSLLTVTGVPHAQFLRFTPADIKALRAGEVWTYERNDAGGRAVAARDFHRRVARECADT
jgi:hypothetical protein